MGEATSDPAAAPSAARGALRERTATVDGLTHRWLARGDERLTGAGPAGEAGAEAGADSAGGSLPIVLVHGLPTGPLLWREVARRLPGRAVLAWELTGYAGSIDAGAGRDLSLSAQASRLERWLVHLGLERVALVGHDIGGGVAQLVAVRAPERVGALVLADAVAFDAWPVLPVRAARALGPFTARVPDRAFAAALTAALRPAYADARVARTSIALHLAPYLEAGGAAALLAQVRALDAADTLAAAAGLATVSCPRAVVWGARDPYLRLGLGRRLAAALRAPLLRVPTGRHFVPEDRPQAVAAAIERVAPV